MTNPAFNAFYRYKAAHPEEDLPDFDTLDEVACWAGYRVEELEAENATLCRDLRDSQNYRIEAAHDRGIEIDQLKQEVSRLRTSLAQARRMAGEQWQERLVSDLSLDDIRVELGCLRKRIVELNEEIADLDFQCNEEASHCREEEERSTIFLDLLNRVNGWIEKHDLGCPICGESGQCKDGCELRSAINEYEDLVNGK